jgi:hypothetical protein
VPQVFLPPTVTFEWALRGYEEQARGSVLVQDRHLVYAPHLLGLGSVRMLDRKRGVDHQEMVARLVWPSEGPTGVDWTEGQTVVSEEELAPKPMGAGFYAPVVSMLARPRELNRLAKDFSDYLYYNIAATILHNPVLDVYGAVGESEREFRKRCEAAARDERDEELEKARDRMDKEMARVQQRLRREQRELDEDESDLEARKREELLSLGESALNLLTRRRSYYMISRASTKRRMTKQAKADVEETQATIEDLEAQLEKLKEEWEEQAGEITDRWAETLDEIEKVAVKPRRADVTVVFCGLAWVPTWQVTLKDGRRIDLPARELNVEAK